MLHLGLVQHSESTDPPSVLQGIQHRCARGVLMCLKLVSMLLLGTPLMETVVELLFRAVSPPLFVVVSYEAFSPPLHFVQQGEVALGTAHPGKWAVFHDGSHLCLVQLQEAICVK